MIALWREIHPTPIDNLSPSAFNNLLACPARVAFARSDDTKGWVRGNTRSALGTVAHRLYEAAAHGNPTGAPMQDWLRATWDELVAEQEHALRAQWPARSVPAPTAWPGYAATKVRLIQRLAQTTGHVQPKPIASPSAGHFAGPPALPWIERKLMDKDRGLFGTPDRVERASDILRVVDLKSGVKQGEVTQAQIRQLVFYAHLVEVELDELPISGVIVDAKGSEAEVPIDRGSVAELLHEISQSVHQFNSQVATSGVVARPAADTCRWCPFKVECRAYWETRDETWPATGGDRIGKVLRSERSEVRLRVMFPQDGQDGEIRVLNVGEDSHPDVGDVLFVVDTDSAGVNAVRMRWDSRMRVVPSSDLDRL